MIEKEARLKVINLSRLEEIKDLRTVWPHEALDFTPWLSQDDNISLLADAVGMDITVDETESSVGDFNVDIFASETGTDRKIIMPNITPHVCRHTYCSNQARAGMNPKTLQYLMGHSDIGVTMNTYTHLGLDDAKDEMIRLEELEQARKELDKTSGIKPMKQNMFKAI